MLKTKQIFAVMMTGLLCMFVTGLMAQDVETYTGMVKGIDWDDDGNVLSAALVFDLEEEDEDGNIETLSVEFLIEDDAIGKQLYELDGRAVEVVGEVSEDDEGVVSIKVKSFKIVAFDDEESSDDEPEEPLQ